MLRHLKFRIDEESLQTKPTDPVTEESSQSTYLTDLHEIDSFLDKHSPSLSGINQYLSALIKIELNKKLDAINLLVKSLNQIPLFWSAWLELARLIADSDQQPFPFLNQISDNWSKNFYILNLFIDNVRISEKVEQLCYDVSCGLIHFFPESTFLKNCLAMFFHNLSDYDNALEFFFQVLSNDPFRFENMDILSNILYVKEKHNELGKLAIRCFEIDKYSPETCCVLGNYYSLIGEHSQAAAQFQRAIMLDKNFLAGYTLLGHEFLELKNLPSAIEAYNSALRVNKKDYRAWYGLGQAYELQNQLHFAIYYFQQTLLSNPKDSRMWNAIGTCFEKMECNDEAEKCFNRGESLNDHEGISLFQLGKMYDLMGKISKAVSCFEVNLNRKREGGVQDKETGETLLYLAYYYKNQGETDKALDLANQLMSFTGIEREEGQNLIHLLNNK